MYQVRQIIQYNQIQNSFPLLCFFPPPFTVSSLGVIYVFKNSSPPGSIHDERGLWVIPQVLEALMHFAISHFYFFPLPGLCLLYVKLNFTLLSFSFISGSEGSFILLLFFTLTIKRIKLLYEFPCHFIWWRDEGGKKALIRLFISPAHITLKKHRGGLAIKM